MIDFTPCTSSVESDSNFADRTCIIYHYLTNFHCYFRYLLAIFHIVFVSIIGKSTKIRLSITPMVRQHPMASPGGEAVERSEPEEEIGRELWTKKSQILMGVFVQQPPFLQVFAWC